MMTKRQGLAILTAIVRAQNPALDRNAAMSETDLLNAIAVIVGQGRGSSMAAEIIVDVNWALDREGRG